MKTVGVVYPKKKNSIGLLYLEKNKLYLTNFKDNKVGKDVTDFLIEDWNSMQMIVAKKLLAK